MPAGMISTKRKCVKTIQKLFNKKRCSLKFRNVYRKTPVLEPLFNKVAGLKARNFFKKRLQRRYFPRTIAKFLRTPILKNICKPLLLAILIPNASTSNDFGVKSIQPVQMVLNANQFRLVVNCRK